MITRRGLLRGAAAGAVGTALFPRTLAAADPPALDGDQALYHLDLTPLYNSDLDDPAQRNAAYDTLGLVFALQGLINRDQPALFVNWTIDDGYLIRIQGDQADMAIPSLPIDAYWLKTFQGEGEWLAQRPLAQIRGLDDLLERFGGFYAGYAVWDPAVNATANVAVTVSGVENLLPLRYDASPTSLYSTLTAGGTTLVGRWLVNPDGSSLFTGSGTIPGTQTPSSGSAKNDAYLWAKQTYLDPGQTSPGALAYYPDAYTLQVMPQTLAVVYNGAPMTEICALDMTALSNLDYVVGNRSFVFDLSPWADEAPVDDPHQPVGTDHATLTAILQSSYDRVGGATTEITGFVPWFFKYCNDGINLGNGTSGHGAVQAEWTFGETISGYNAYTDSDALPGGAMTNASLLAHFPLQDAYPQNVPATEDELIAAGYLDAAGQVVPKRYVMFYAGDYDSSAWTYRLAARYWSDPARGQVPLNWGFNPNLDSRIGAALAYLRAQRSANDWFVAGDSGAGYLNPGMLEPPARAGGSGLSSGVQQWQQHCETLYARWGITITGFIINGDSPAMSDVGRSSYTTFSPDGVIEQNFGGATFVGDTPWMGMMLTDVAGQPSAAANQIAQSFTAEGGLTATGSSPAEQAPGRPQFYTARTIIESPSWHAQVVDAMSAGSPDAEVAFVDAYTFFSLLGRDVQANPVVITATESQLGLSAATPTEISVTVTSRLSDSATGSVALTGVPPAWTVTPSPAVSSVELAPGGSQTVTFTITPPLGASAATSIAVSAQGNWPEARIEIPVTGAGTSAP